MRVLVTCKNEDPIINGVRVVTTLYINSSRSSRAANSVVPGPILPNFHYFQDTMYYGCTRYMQEKKIQSKLKALEWSQHYTLIFQMPKGS